MKSSKPSLKLELKKFDPSKIKDDSVIVAIAARNRGKSVCIKDILSYHFNIPIGMVISPTEHANAFFQNFIPKMLIHDEYSPGLIEKYVNRQQKISGKYKKELEQYGTSSIDPRSFLVMDDAMYDKSWVNDQNIRKIFMNGRHYKIFFLLTMQFPMGISPALRTNIDYVFIFKENIKKNKERLYEHYAGMFPTLQVFEQVLEQVTQDYGCLVIDNRASGSKLEDQVFWYKADPSKKMKMCDSALWDLQAVQDEKERNIVDTDENDEIDEKYDPNIIIKNNKNSCKITVKKSYY
jgi:hypothetical protein